MSARVLVNVAGPLHWGVFSFRDMIPLTCCRGYHNMRCRGGLRRNLQGARNAGPPHLAGNSHDSEFNAARSPDAPPTLAQPGCGGL